MLGGHMRELSVFIDESGDFGAYELHAPFYVISLVMHDQSLPIAKDIAYLKRHVSEHAPYTQGTRLRCARYA